MYPHGGRAFLSATHANAVKRPLALSQEADKNVRPPVFLRTSHPARVRLACVECGADGNVGLTPASPKPRGREGLINQTTIELLASAFAIAVGRHSLGSSFFYER